MSFYLAWPVQLKTPMAHVPAHITLKYLGMAETTVNDVRARLKGLETKFEFSNARWRGETFDRQSYVMVLEGLDSALLKTRAAVDNIRTDDYPEWRPHLTLEKSIWSFITHGNLTPQQVIRTIGSLTLYMDDRAIATFP